MNAVTIKNHRLSAVDLRSRRSVQQRHMLHTRAVYIAVQLYIITACMHGCIDVLYTCVDNNVISSYHNQLCQLIASPTLYPLRHRAIHAFKAVGMKLCRYQFAEMVLLCRNNATINAHVKTQNLVKHRSDTLTRDQTRSKSVTRDPVPSLCLDHFVGLQLIVDYSVDQSTGRQSSELNNGDRPSVILDLASHSPQRSNLTSFHIWI